MSYFYLFLKKIHLVSGKILYFNLVSMIFIGLIDSAAIFLLLPMINLTGIYNIESPHPELTWLIGLFDGIPETVGLVFVLGLYLILVIGQSFFQRSQIILSTKIQQKFTRNLREETYNLLLKADWAFFLRTRKTNITNTMINEIAKVSGGTNLLLQFISSGIFASIQIGLALWLSTKMTITVVLFGSCLLFFLKSFVKKSESFGEHTLELSQLFLGGITDHFNGIKDIKSNNLEATHIKWFHALNEKMENNMIYMTKLKSSSYLVYKIISALLLVILVFFSIKMLKAQPAQLLIITIIFSRLWPIFSGIQSNLEQMASLIPSYKTVTKLQLECKHSCEMKDENSVSFLPLKMSKSLECKNVFFRYDHNQEKYALKDINIKIPVNSMTAIVGHSGAGKSTLVDVLIGLNSPEKGSILLDGQPLTPNDLISMRKSVSYVSQDPFLFNSTIRENLQLVNEKASERQIWEALDFAAAHFVKNLPEGLDTLIGDRGIRLSGGERQRLVLARAILKKPDILVLDEATSALDSDNEYQIQVALEKLKNKMTIIIIAHRLSTIKNADQIIVLNQGGLVQVGSYKQLEEESNGTFFHLLGRTFEKVM